MVVFSERTTNQGTATLIELAERPACYYFGHVEGMSAFWFGEENDSFFKTDDIVSNHSKKTSGLGP